MYKASPNLNSLAVICCLLAFLTPALADSGPLQVPCFLKDELTTVLKEKYGEDFTGETFMVSHSQGPFDIQVYANRQTGGFHLVGLPQDATAHNLATDSACIMDAKPQGYPDGVEFEQYRSILEN